jgi:hypothetical protein
MSTIRRTLVTSAAAGALAVGLATPAAAATGHVIVFSTESSALRTWDHPSGCFAFPVGAHLLLNDTTRAITVYADPLCLIPAQPTTHVAAGHGVHVDAIGGFRA